LLATASSLTKSKRCKTLWRCDIGYTTDFWGEWTVTPTLSGAHKAYLTQFAVSRRVRRDAAKAELLPDPLRIAVGLPIGLEGAYYVGTVDKVASQNVDDSVLDGNDPPGSPEMPISSDPNNAMADWGIRFELHQRHRREANRLGLAQPGLWCQWIPNETGEVIEWDEGEKFYDYIEWIEYLILHFLGPWGYKLNGVVEWHGEENDDRGRIEIVDNEVIVRHAVITWT